MVLTFDLFFGPAPIFLTQIDQSGEQRQWNVVDTMSLSLVTHQFKFGITTVHCPRSSRAFSPYANYFYYSEGTVQANSVDHVVGHSQSAAYPVYINFSAFAQDDWRITPRLSLSMGLRWEVILHPGPRTETFRSRPGGEC